MAENEPGGWLLLIHQIPPKPDYFRVKVWRRLQRLGAVAIKNSVYALPQSDRALEDFQWVLREIIEGGGDGSVCAARFVDGLTDQQIEALFHAARDAEYAALAEEARALADRAPRGRRTAADHVAQLTAQVGRLRRRLGEIVALDVLGAPGREAAEGLVGGLEASLRRAAQPARAATKMGGAGARLQRRTWVTRSGVHVDRMASAWLIQRFIDPKARFKFVAAKGYVPKAGELRFDMFEAEYTHQGDRCTFEVLIGRAGVRDAALQPIAEIVHDIDLKDAKYRRPEAAGIDRLIAGIAMGTKDDEERVRAAATVWDGLYEYFRRKPG